MSRRNGARKRRQGKPAAAGEEALLREGAAAEPPEETEERSETQEIEEGEVSVGRPEDAALEADAACEDSELAELGIPADEGRGEASTEEDSDLTDPVGELNPSDEESGSVDAEASSDADEVREEASSDDEDADAALASAEAPPLGSVIEAVLFASAEPVPLKRLARLLSSWSRSDIEAAVEELRHRLSEEDRGIRLVEAAGGLQLRSSERFAPWVRRFFAERPPRLSRPVLETLAIIAYRQPVTRGEVEQVRGVNCDAVLGALTSRGLIRISGRRASPGRPAEYATTEAFLELFTLGDLGELPPLPDPAALANLVAEAPEPEEGEGEDVVEGEAVDAAGGAAPGDSREAGDAGEDDPRGDDGDHAEEIEVDGEASAAEHAASPEDSEPGGDRLAEDGGRPDPERPGEGERPGGAGAGDARGPDSGPHHG